MRRSYLVVALCAVIILSTAILSLASAEEAQPAVPEAAEQQAASQTEEQAQEAAPQQTEPVIEIEVTGERERPAHVDVIRAEDVKEMPGVQNIGDAIQRLPGTQSLTGCLMNSPRPSLRGSSYTWLQVLVDGIPVNPTGSCTLNRVSASGLGEIEVVRGPAAPKYPGNTVSGVMAMALKRGDQFPGGEFTFTGGSFGTQIWDL